MAVSPIHLVWLKRDLRLRDHAPLRAASRSGEPVLLLYCIEPELVDSPHYVDRHWRFIWESLEDLNQQLAPYGGAVWAVYNSVLPTLEWLNAHYTIRGIYSHQETGLKRTFDRDLAVKRYCEKQQLKWVEFPQDGVIRGRKHRLGFPESVDAFLGSSPIETSLAAITFQVLPSEQIGKPIPSYWQQYQSPFQPGGEQKAWAYLRGFLKKRSRNYGRHLAKPALSRQSCSRISPYLAHGNISLRELWQWAARAGQQPSIRRDLEHFRERLWWRTHYLQKLEAEWQMEFEPINRNLTRLDRQLRSDWLTAWSEGQTGFPMVDASMRCLKATGWLNFRMRAMLVTFASFALWQPFQLIAEVLAQRFLDFEPGIHFPQIQMQAGLTAYHPLRIFSPIIQGEQHDPEGLFVYRWVPELRAIPAPYCHYPWRLTDLEKDLYQFQLGVDYPAPLVDYDQTIRAAKERYWAVRQEPATQALLPDIWAKHCLVEKATEYRRMAGISVD